MIKEHLRTREKLAREPMIKSCTNTGSTFGSGRGSALPAGLSGDAGCPFFCFILQHVIPWITEAACCSKAETLPPTKICSSLELASRNLPNTLRNDRAPAYRHMKKLRRWFLLQCLTNTCEDLRLMLLTPGKKAGYKSMYLDFQLCASTLWRIPG